MNRDRKIAIIVIAVLVVVVLFVITTFSFTFWLGEKASNIPTNQTTVQSSDKVLRQVKDFNRPVIASFQPCEEFVVVENCGAIPINNIFLEMILVKRLKDDIVFQVAKKIPFDPLDRRIVSGMKVKLFQIYWEENLGHDQSLSVRPLPARFLLALPPDEAAHYSASLPKNASR